MTQINNNDEWILFFDYLGDEIVSRYGVSKDIATLAVNGSFIQELVQKYPLFVGHEPIESWAEYVYLEMIA